MGQQQLLIILLGVVIVGIAIAAGMGLFGASKVNANRDAIISDMNDIAVNAFKFKSRPRVLAGGGGSYLGFVLSEKYRTNPNASYACTSTETEMTIHAISTLGAASTITGKIGVDGRLIKAEFVFTGEFQ